MSKSLGVALVEQVGGLIAMAAYLVAVQHIMATSVLHRPEESWALAAWKRWQNWRLDKERESLRVWSLEPVEEPKVKPENLSRED